MGKKISRKKFIVQGAAGLATLGLLSSMKNTGTSRLSTSRALGKTGIMVPPVCFGATRINEENLLRYAIDQGFTFLDTGRSYANGNNERMVGRAISGIRSEVIIQSKIRLDMQEIPSGPGTRKGAAEITTLLSKRLDESLRALNTDYIDILLYHDAADESLVFHKAVMAFFELKKSEKIIRAFGFSTHNDCMNLAERNNTEGFYEVMMMPFNFKGSYIHSLNKTYSEWDQGRLIPILKEAGKNETGFIAMKTCSAGPYQPEGSSVASFPGAVNWVLEHDFVSSAAVAMSNSEEIAEHIAYLKQ